MAAPLDLAAQSAALDAMLGDAAASTMPAAFELALWDGDPRVPGTAELEADGDYARVTGIANDSTNFPDAVDGVKAMTPQLFADSSDAWSAPGTYWVLIDAADSTTQWFFGLPDKQILVSAAGTSVALAPRIYWNQS